MNFKYFPNQYRVDMTNDSRFSNFIDEVNAFSAGKLKNTDDLKALIEIVEEKGRHNGFLEVIFFSKFVVKFYRILRKGNPGSDEDKKMSKEFSIHFEKVRDLLKLLVRSNERNLALFNAKYFSDTVESCSNLLDLLNDLAWVKNWHIDNKKLW